VKYGQSDFDALGFPWKERKFLHRVEMVVYWRVFESPGSLSHQQSPSLLEALVSALLAKLLAQILVKFRGSVVPPEGSAQRLPSR
jgi:hypothetical protein